MSGFGMGQSNAGGGTGFGGGVGGGGGGFGQAPVASSMDASTPWVAASDGNLLLLQQSITSLNVPIGAKDENGYTLLQAASSYNKIPVLEWLLSQIQQQQQAQDIVNAVDNEGDSALHYSGGAHAAKFLVEQARIDVNIRNNEGKTALEAKKAELEEMKEDEDYEEDDVDAVNLKETIAYLISLSSQAQ